MRRLDELLARLRRLDGAPYPAYREAAGSWQAEGWRLNVEHVQPDPFATPSRVSVELPVGTHRIPSAYWQDPSRRLGTTNYLLWRFSRVLVSTPGGSGHSGRFFVDAGGPQLLERSACEFRPDGTLLLRFRVGLPARGRRILGRAAAELLGERLPRAIRALCGGLAQDEDLRRWAKLAEDHAALRAQLADRGLVAFVRDGSILPRVSGVSQEPLRRAVPFESPPSLRVRLEAPNEGVVEGMGIPTGVTVITGGGFHGKTTLLEALELGVYPHRPADGREWVVTRADAVKVRSEDGRAVTGVDLRPFIDRLPGGKDTSSFTTQDASGSTSLAAAILEALEMGAGVLMIDEDTAATNLLVRDERMRQLVRNETITPLIDRARELAERFGVSVVLVTGGIGDYLRVADTVIVMDEYRPRDATEEARALAGGVRPPALEPLRLTPREVDPASLDPHRHGRVKVRARGLRELVYGEEVVDVTGLEQLVDDSQVRAVGALLQHIWRRRRGWVSVREAVAEAVEFVRREGLSALDPSPELAMPRPFEVAASLNRLRGVRIRPGGGS